jgi:DNA polymerase (family 10)
VRNREVAAVLNELADTMELLGEDRYRVAGYRDAATHVEHYAEPIEVLARDGRIGQIHGVGKSIGSKIAEYLDTGRVEALEERRTKVPPAAMMLMHIPGIGPKRALLLAKELAVRTVEDLEAALASGQVASLPRLGEKVAASILEEVQRLRTRSQRLPLAVALPACEQIGRELRAACPEAIQAMAPAGSLRRMRDTVGDMDILVASSEPAQVIEAFTSLGPVRHVLAAGETRASVLTHADLQIDLRVVARGSFGAALQYFTGSKAHNVKLREIAIRKGYKLNEYGVYAGEQSLAGETEEGVYQALGLAWVPPEIREDAGEIELARRGNLPCLVELADIQGDLHAHTRLSDGSSSIEQMARAAAQCSYTYLAITDHSQALGVAGGLTEDELREEHAQIRALQPSFPELQLLCGVEVDIRVDERLDCSDEFLASCDVVVASIHSAFQKSAAEQTARLLAAIHNPHVDIIGHPTGRLLGKRAGYDIDLPAILDAAAKTGTALEVSGQPERLDLDADAIRAAVERGVLLVLDTDAHEHSQIGDLMRYAVGTARRGWASRDMVLNTRGAEDLQAWLASRSASRV